MLSLAELPLLEGFDGFCKELLTGVQSHDALQSRYAAATVWSQAEAVSIAGLGWLVWSLIEDAWHVAWLPWSCSSSATHSESHRLLYRQASLLPMLHTFCHVMAAWGVASCSSIWSKML